METLEGLSKKMPVRVVQKLQKPIPLEVIAAQLHLNGWLDEQLVDRLLGNAKECIITIFPTDYGSEAVISGTPAQTTKQKTEFPGMQLAQNTSDVTILKELKRASDYIGRKYASRMGSIRVLPNSYTICNIHVFERGKIAQVNLERQMRDFATEHSYWQSYVAPELNEDEGRAVKALEETFQHYQRSKGSPHTEEEAWARTMASWSVYALLEMMAQHGRKNVPVKTYNTHQGRYELDNLYFCLFYDPKTAKKIHAGERQLIVNLEHVKKV